MTMDTYTHCPCGSGKKIKFCCSRDIVHDLEKILRAADGDQRVAALDMVNRLLDQHPDRPVLLTLKVQLLDDLGQADEWSKAVTDFLKVAPRHPSALAFAAIDQCHKGNERTAVRYVQRMLEETESSYSQFAYQAMGLLAHALAEKGYYMSARAHAEVLFAMDTKNRDATRLLLEIMADRQVPTVQKNIPTFVDCPENVPWKGEYTAAKNCAAQARWLLACEQLTSLNDKVPNQPAILRSLAALHCLLLDYSAAAEALRRYAQLADLPEDDAVATEALAQSVDPHTESRRSDRLMLTYTVRDAQQANERLLSHRRMSAFSSTAADDEEPRAKGSYALLDKPMPATGVGLERREMPNILASVELYGKQTDRDARLEVFVPRREDLLQTRKGLAELLGDLIAPITEKVVGTWCAIQSAMTLQWRAPRDVPTETMARLVTEERRARVLDVWTQLPLAVLEGKTPRQVAADPAYRVRLLAAILLLELQGDSDSWEVDFNELRNTLGLPPAVEFDGANLDVNAVPLHRLARLRLDNLSDKDLIATYERAVTFHVIAAVRRLSSAILAREDLEDRVPRSLVYTNLARLAATPESIIDNLRKAAAAAAAAGKSTVDWLLMEIEICLRFGLFGNLSEPMQKIRPHFHEPGVVDQLMSMFAARGLVTEDGKLLLPQLAPEEPPAATPAPASPIWTPETAAQATSSSGKLWLPGD